MGFVKEVKVVFMLFCCWMFSIVYIVRSGFLFLLPRKYRRKDITGEVVLITGGASGIGQKLAIEMASRKAKVIIWDVDEEANKSTVHMITSQGGECYAYTVDVSNPYAVTKTAADVNMRHGMVNILVNNAGILRSKDFLIDSPEVIKHHFDVNVLSNFWTVREFLPAMKRENRGQIVTMSSIMGKIGAPKLMAYSVSKYAAAGFDENLRIELDAEGYNGITTTLLCPYIIKTALTTGVRIRLGGNLDLDYSVKEITDAILMQTRRLYIPPKLQLLITLKPLVHNKVEKWMNFAAIGKDPFNTKVENESLPKEGMVVR